MPLTDTRLTSGHRSKGGSRATTPWTAPGPPPPAGSTTNSLETKCTVNAPCQPAVSSVDAVGAQGCVTTGARGSVELMSIDSIPLHAISPPQSPTHTTCTAAGSRQGCVTSDARGCIELYASNGQAPYGSPSQSPVMTCAQICERTGFKLGSSKLAGGPLGRGRTASPEDAQRQDELSVAADAPPPSGELASPADDRG